MPTIISHKFKFIFCHIPKAAGTSFMEYVKPYLGPDDDIDSFDKHTPLSLIEKSRHNEVFDKYLKIAIIRDPKERRARLDLARIDQNETDEFYWTDDKWIRDNSGNILTDVLIDFDNVETETVDLLETMGIPKHEFPHIRTDIK